MNYNFLKITFCSILIFFVVIFVLKFLFTAIYPYKYSEFIEKYSKEYDVDSKLVYAIIKQESNFNPKVSSNKGAMGLMQLMESTAKEIEKKMGNTNINLSDPETNIRIGIKHLSDLLNKYKNTKIAVVAYNAGMGNVDNWINKGIIKSDGSDLENVPYRETNMYLRKVIKNYKIYCNLY